jgi:hypothetical protein
MPYKRRNPVSESEMDRTRYERHHTICQTLRDIYHMTTDSEIKLKCRVGVAMAKAMQERLKFYHKKEKAGWSTSDAATVSGGTPLTHP